MKMKRFFLKCNGLYIFRLNYDARFRSGSARELNKPYNFQSLNPSVVAPSRFDDQNGLSESLRAI